MHILAALGSVALILIVLWDAFEVIILPRRVTRKFRLARLFYRNTWRPWSAAVRRVSKVSRREVLLLVTAGVAAGLPLAWGMARLVQAQLYGITPHDPLSIAGATLLLASVALLSL